MDAVDDVEIEAESACGEADAGLYCHKEQIERYAQDEDPVYRRRDMMVVMIAPMALVYMMNTFLFHFSSSESSGFQRLCT